LARVLDVPVSFFYDGVNEGAGQPGFSEGDQTPIVDDFIQSADGVALAQAFARIKRFRRCAAEFLSWCGRWPLKKRKQLRPNLRPNSSVTGRVLLSVRQ
jgi:hypothetical protein